MSIHTKETPKLLKSLKLGETIVDLNAILTAPYEDVREASFKLPQILAFLAQQRAWAYERCWKAERELERAESKAYMLLKSGQFVAKGYGERATEESLKRAVVLEDSVIAAENVYIECKRKYESFGDTISALKLKIDLIRSSETTRRWTEDPEFSPTVKK
jgi:hypothetical protein